MAEQGRRDAKAKVPLPRTRKTEGPRARRTRRTSSTRPLEILAIDFETADYGRDSACAFGLAHIVGGEIIETADYLIRPPRSEFAFSWLRGITRRQPFSSLAGVSASQHVIMSCGSQPK